MTMENEIQQIASRARTAATAVAELDTAAKDAWLLRCAERLESARERILEANARDMQAAEQNGVAAPMVRRLALEGRKWDDMLDGLRHVATLPDPVGEVSEMRVRPNGLRVGRMRIPLGVICMIYE